MSKTIQFKSFTVLCFSRSGEQEWHGKFSYKKMRKTEDDFATIARKWLKGEYTNKDGTARPWNKDVLCYVFQAADRGFYLCEDDLKC